MLLYRGEYVDKIMVLFTKHTLINDGAQIAFKNSCFLCSGNDVASTGFPCHIVTGFCFCICFWICYEHFFFHVLRTCVMNTLASSVIFSLLLFCAPDCCHFTVCELFLRSYARSLTGWFVRLLSFNLLNYVIVRARLADYIITTFRTIQFTAMKVDIH